MTAITSASAGATAALQHAVAARPAAKINDGDGDDAPTAAPTPVAPQRLATSGPGQLINKLA